MTSLQTIRKGRKEIVGLYSNLLFPIACDFLMSRSALAEARQELLSRVRGEVLEIGFGTGLNLRYYGAGVRKVTAVDVNPGMAKRARRRIEDHPVPVDIRLVDGAALPLKGDSFDSVVTTWTLCSIRDVGRALEEIDRVMKPDGSLYFIEHGLSDDPRTRRWQNWLTPLQRFIAEGCHLNRDIRALIEGQNFEITELKQYEMDGAPRTHGHTYQGIARRRPSREGLSKGR